MVQPDRQGVRPANLLAAFPRSGGQCGAAGVDHETVEMFEQHWEANLEKLAPISCGTGPTSRRRCGGSTSPKPGSDEKRPLGIPTVATGSCKTALRQRAGTDLRAGLRRTQLRLPPGTAAARSLASRRSAAEERATRYVVDADLKSYFDTIPHEPADGAREGEGIGRPGAGAVRGVPEARYPGGLAKSWTPEAGTPQGR